MKSTRIRPLSELPPCQRYVMVLCQSMCKTGEPAVIERHGQWPLPEQPPNADDSDRPLLTAEVSFDPVVQYLKQLCGDNDPPFFEMVFHGVGDAENGRRGFACDVTFVDQDHVELRVGPTDGGGPFGA